MEHSIAARFAARPAARFVRPSFRARQRQLGLRSAGGFLPASTRPTVLRHPDVAPLVALRAGWRAIRPAHVRRVHTGPPRPVTSMQWARSGRTGATPRPSTAVAPWRG